MSESESLTPEEFDEIRLARQIGIVPEEQIDRIADCLQKIADVMETERLKFQSVELDCKLILKDRIIALALVSSFALFPIVLASIGFGSLRVYLAIAGLVLVVVAIFALIKITGGYIRHRHCLSKSFNEDQIRCREVIARIRGEIDANNRMAQMEFSNPFIVGAAHRSAPTLH